MPKKRDPLIAAIQEILFCDWDPIGINFNEVLRDEYDSYIGTIYRYLREGADELKIVSHLRQLQQNSMGLSNIDEELDRQVARRLLSLIQTPGNKTRIQL